MPNRSLLTSWMQRWNRSLLRFLGSRVRSEIVVEDLAQETYLRLLRLPDLASIRNPEAYLIRVASHIVAEWRMKHPPTESLVEIEAQAALVDERSPDLELEAALSQEAFDRTLAEFSPMLRAVVVLRLREQMRYKEIAEKLGITERMVKRHLARGYDKLRAAFE